jgi:hypothetical protein
MRKRSGAGAMPVQVSAEQGTEQLDSTDFGYRRVAGRISRRCHDNQIFSAQCAVLRDA